MKTLESVNLLVVGSNLGTRNGIPATTAIRHWCRREIQTEFYGGPSDKEFNPTLFGPAKSLLLVGISLHFESQEVLNSFVSLLIKCGHTIVGVVDSLGKDAWEKAFAENKLDFSSLEIAPLDFPLPYEGGKHGFHDYEEWIYHADREKVYPGECFLKFVRSLNWSPERETDYFISLCLNPEGRYAKPGIFEFSSNRSIETSAERSRYLINRFVSSPNPDDQILEWAKPE